MFDANEAINDIIEELEITEANKDFIGNMNKAVNTKINKIKNAGTAKIQKLKNDGIDKIKNVDKKKAAIVGASATAAGIVGVKTVRKIKQEVGYSKDAELKLLRKDQVQLKKEIDSTKKELRDKWRSLVKDVDAYNRIANSLNAPTMTVKDIQSAENLLKPIEGIDEAERLFANEDKCKQDLIKLNNHLDYLKIQNKIKTIREKEKVYEETCKKLGKLLKKTKAIESKLNKLARKGASSDEKDKVRDSINDMRTKYSNELNTLQDNLKK